LVNQPQIFRQKLGSPTEIELAQGGSVTFSESGSATMASRILAAHASLALASSQGA
jgi:hypothetical protein